MMRSGAKQLTVFIAFILEKVKRKLSVMKYKLVRQVITCLHLLANRKQNFQAQSKASLQFGKMH